MTDLDRLIAETLDEEDRALLDRYGAEQGLWGQVASVFRGALGWYAVLVGVVQMALFGFSLWCAWNFAVAEDVAAMLRWGGAAWFLFTGVMMIKLWFWLQMTSNQIRREVKRLELQVARSRLDDAA